MNITVRFFTDSSVVLQVNIPASLATYLMHLFRHLKYVFLFTLHIEPGIQDYKAWLFHLIRLGIDFYVRSHLY